MKSMNRKLGDLITVYEVGKSVRAAIITAESPLEITIFEKRKLRFNWTCSDYVHHSHKWKWSAWLCGRWQKYSDWTFAL